MEESYSKKELLRSKKIVIILSIAMVIIIAFFTVVLKNEMEANKKYSEIRDFIINKELKEDMFDEGEYSEFLLSDKSNEILTEYLNSYKESYDYESALYLCSVLPHSVLIDVIDDSFVEWIVGHGKRWGVYSTNKDPECNYEYLANYELQDYNIRIGVSFEEYTTDIFFVSEAPAEELEYTLTCEKGYVHGKVDWTFPEDLNLNCEYGGCRLTADNGTRYCLKHLCTVNGCGLSKSPFASCCEVHACLKCGSAKWGNTNYCIEHQY